MTLTVTDTANLSATQTYKVVVTSPPSDAVYITSSPVTFATANNVYLYDVQAVSSLSLPLTFSLPTPAPGMTINPVTGQIVWTPTSSNDGANPVTVRAVDTGGAFANQTYTLRRARTRARTCQDRCTIRNQEPSGVMTARGGGKASAHSRRSREPYPRQGGTHAFRGAVIAISL